MVSSKINNDKIHVMVMGGTIDSIDIEIPFPKNPTGKSIIPDFMRTIKLDERIAFTTICMKDSRELTKDDFIKLHKNIKKCKANEIIVTSGTYNMPDIARFLETALKNNKKTIVLTGSTLPIYGFPLSDGPFNIGYSVAMVRQLKSGVYVCMNGNTFTPGEVFKLVSEGKFESIFNLK